MKICTICKTDKLLTEYYQDARRGDGRMSRCKKCHNVMTLKYRSNNLGKVRAQERKWHKTHPGKRRSDRALRHATELQATPKWLTPEDRRLIKQFYGNCPEGYEVDHVVPLRGKNVRGLHTLTNLQYLPKNENRRKSNKTEHLDRVR